MRQFAVICKTELLLFTREFFSFFFTLVFPVLMLLLMGGVFGNAPIYEGAEIKMMDVSVPAYGVMVIGVNGLMSLPLTMAGYKEKKIYKRFDATPAGKKSVMLAQVCVNLAMTLAGISVLIAAGKLLYHTDQGLPSRRLPRPAVFHGVPVLHGVSLYGCGAGREKHEPALLFFLFCHVIPVWRDHAGYAFSRSREKDLRLFAHDPRG